MTLHLIHESVLLRRGLVADASAKHLRRMKQSVWLYLYLLLAANRERGRRLLDPVRVATEMGISEATARSWLGHLRQAGYVTIRREGEHLEVTVTRWRTVERSGQEAPIPASSGPAGVDRRSVEALARALGADPDDPFLAQAVRETDPKLLEQVLEATLRVPAIKIKKSRVALFRYLLAKRQRT